MAEEEEMIIDDGAEGAEDGTDAAGLTGVSTEDATAAEGMAEDEGEMEGGEEEDEMSLLASSEEDAEKKRRYKEYLALLQEIEAQNKIVEELKAQIMELCRRPCKTACEMKQIKSLHACMEQENLKLRCLITKAMQLQNFGSRRRYKEIEIATTITEDQMAASYLGCMQAPQISEDSDDDDGGDDSCDQPCQSSTTNTRASSYRPNKDKSRDKSRDKNRSRGSKDKGRDEARAKKINQALCKLKICCPEDRKLIEEIANLFLKPAGESDPCRPRSRSRRDSPCPQQQESSCPPPPCGGSKGQNRQSRGGNGGGSGCGSQIAMLKEKIMSMQCNVNNLMMEISKREASSGASKCGGGPAAGNYNGRSGGQSSCMPSGGSSQNAGRSNCPPAAMGVNRSAGRSLPSGGSNNASRHNAGGRSSCMPSGGSRTGRSSFIPSGGSRGAGGYGPDGLPNIDCSGADSTGNNPASGPSFGNGFDGGMGGNGGDFMCPCKDPTSESDSCAAPNVPQCGPQMDDDPATLCGGKRNTKSNQIEKLKQSYLHVLSAFDKKNTQCQEMEKRIKSLCSGCGGGNGGGGARGGKGNKDCEDTGNEAELELLRERVMDLREEQAEFKCLIKEQASQVDDYRQKYLMAQQTVEEQCVMLEKLNMNNKRIEKQINIEVKEIRAKFQEKLNDLMHLPKLLENEQLKLAQACKEKEELQAKLALVCKELKSIKEGGTDGAPKEDCRPKLLQCTIELEKAKSTIEELTRQRDLFCEQLATTQDDLDTLRSESAKIIARTKERAEVTRQQMANQMHKIEKELAQCRATASLSVTDREAVIREMQGQLNTLSYSFDAAQKQIKTLRNHIAYVSNENCFPVKC